MRYLLGIAFFIIIFCSIHFQSMAAQTLSGQPQGNVTVEDFDFFEVGIKLEEGQKIEYSFDANSIMLFSLHRHEGGEVITEYVRETKSHSDIFTAPQTADYYLLWENLGEIAHDLDYKISLPRQVLGIDYGGTSYDLEVLTNSKVEVVAFNATSKQLSLNMVTPFLTPGFANITLPKELLNGDIKAQGGLSQTLVSYTNSYSQINLHTDLGTHEIVIQGTTVIPEFPYSLVILPMALSMLLVWRFQSKRRFR